MYYETICSFYFAQDTFRKFWNPKNFWKAVVPSTRLTRLINPLGLQEFIMHSINPVKPLSNHTSYSPYRVILESLTSRYVLMIDEGVNIYEVFR